MLPHYGLKLATSQRGALMSLLWQRARLRLRGMGYTKRSAAEVPSRLIEHVDVLLPLATSMHTVDTIRAAALSTHAVRLSLDSGEPSRVALAFAGEALLSGFEGPPGERRADAMLSRARELAKARHEPYLFGRGLMELCAGIVAHLGRRGYRESLGRFDDAARIFGDLPGAGPAQSAAHFMATEALFWLGEIAELRRRVPIMLSDSRRRGDLSLQVPTVGALGHFAWLAADQPQQLRELIEETMSKWSQSGFKVGHYYAELGRTSLALYEGSAAAALEHLERTFPLAYRAARFWQEGRILCFDYLARTLLAAAQRSDRGTRAPLLQRAHKCTRKLQRERSPLSEVLAPVLRAGIAAAGNDQETAISLLEAAEQAAAAREMELYVACARRRRGQLVGGDQGRELVAAADAFMTEQQIKRPDKMTALLLPGYPD